jgi:hypothetical protein
MALLIGTMTASLGWSQGNSPIVEAHAVTATDAAHADSAAKVAIVAQVAPGYHINDHKPSLDYLIPTKFVADSSDQFSVKNIAYPKGSLKKFPFSDVPLSVYEGSVVVGIMLQVGKDVPVGTYALKGKFAYQACNEHACLPPTSVPVTIDIKVVPHQVSLKSVNKNVFQRIKFE